MRAVYKIKVEELLELIEKQTSEVLKTSEVCLRLTKHGRLLGNQVFMRFV
jgi:coproporphyrinogen III oxidase-like Fe-S oxidoreductase